MPLATLEPELWLGATRSAAIRDASLHLGIALNIVSFAVTLAINLNRARLHSALILSSLDIGSLLNLIVAATQFLEAHDRVTACHLAGWAIRLIESTFALLGFVMGNTQTSGSDS
jgi:hypothetical protein